MIVEFSPTPDQYAWTFGNAPVEFGAHFSGFKFDAVWLTAKLASA